MTVPISVEMVPVLDMYNDSTTLNISLEDNSEGSSSTPGLSRTAHTVVAVCLGCILLLGSLYNALVLLIFAKFAAVRTPINMILLNISVSDLLVCVFSFAASVSGEWVIGQQGCKWYGFCNSLFGIVSLVSLSMLSYERYLTVLKCSKVGASNYRNACACIVGSWIYSLFGQCRLFLAGAWSSYGLESSGTTCSVVWHSRSHNNVSYILCLFLFCLVLPLLIMIFSYGHIVKVIRGLCRINLTTAQRREHHLLFMILCMITCYLFCWMPYGLVSLITTFGQPGIISPTISIIPSILAKSSTFINPLIYIFMNRQFYRCFIALLKCESEPHDIDITFNLRHSKKLQDKEDCKIQSCFHQALQENGTMSSTGKQKQLTLVVHYIDYT